MSRHVINPTSNYYHFAFEPEDDDDDADDPTISPVDEDPELLPEMYDCHLLNNNYSIGRC